MQIPIVLCFNDNYSIAAGVTMHSICYNCKINQLDILKNISQKQNFGNHIIHSNIALKARIIKILLNLAIKLQEDNFLIYKRNIKLAMV